MIFAGMLEIVIEIVILRPSRISGVREKDVWLVMVAAMKSTWEMNIASRSSVCNNTSQQPDHDSVVG
jgi:hypothetical protein